MFSTKAQIVNTLGGMRQKTLVTIMLLYYWSKKAARYMNVPSVMCSNKSLISKACGRLDLATVYRLLTLLQKGRELVCLLFLPLTSPGFAYITITLVRLMKCLFFCARIMLTHD